MASSNSASGAPATIPVPADIAAQMGFNQGENASATGPAPGFGEYFSKPPIKRKDKLGRYDVTTPKHLIDTNDNYAAVISTIENRHPDEQLLIEHYAKQLVAQKEGTYDPLEDPPVILRDLLPTLGVVVNKVFTKDEVIAGGGDVVIKQYVQKLKDYVDIDIIPVLCGRPIILPYSFKLPAEHRDPLYNAQMQTFYKRNEQSAAELVERIENARADAKKRNAEMEAKQAEAAAAAKAAAEAEEAAKTLTQLKEGENEVDEESVTPGGTQLNEEDDAE
jgi:hypothetical protein